MPKAKPKRRLQRGLEPIAVPFSEAVRRILLATPKPEKPARRRKKPS